MTEPSPAARIAQRAAERLLAQQVEQWLRRQGRQ